MGVAISEMNVPKISVVTPSYNQGQYLEKTILSVLDQHYPNLEYIIVDGGSSDNSVEIIKKYEKYLKYWVSEPDRGQSHAINKGFEHATGDLFAWLNSDDYYSPAILGKVAELYLTNPDADVFVGAGQMINSTGKVVLYKGYPSGGIDLDTIYNWLSGHDFMQPSCFFTRKAWEKSGALDETIHIALDVDLWLRMARNNFKFIATPELLSTSLAHDKAKTTAYRHLMVVDASIVIIKHGGEQAVRRHLEDMAQRLSYLEKIINHPLLKLLRPFSRVIVKHVIRRRETPPDWLNHCLQKPSDKL